ncbi:MAG: alpha-amylase family protein [Rhodoferax sp.]|nr:alpha-amylase family protein [Actinomycetota bacterium]
MTLGAARDAAAAGLADLPEHRRVTFDLRLQRWWPDLVEGLTEVYADAGPLARRLVRLAAAAYREREPELLRLDEQRTLAPDWSQLPTALGYAAYADRFAGNLAGVAERVPYLRELGVTYLHLLPLLRPREGDNDGGYAVVDYGSVRPDLGTMDDLRALAGVLRRQGISLVLDLVINHVAAEHAWAVAARAGDPRYRAYFHTFPDRELPDAYERTLPEVFPTLAPGSFTWDDDLQAFVWTTFNTWQWDLNWANPDVLVEFADIALMLANTGVEVLRLDAIAFLWKRLGTSSQNQPEVHAIIQALRAVARIACPALTFKAEAIVGPDELVRYLGQGRHHGKVSDLAYHNGLMVQIWSMLATRDVRLAVHALRALPPTPTTTAWVTYLRCHDDIGWAISDDDAAAVGVTGQGHREFLSDYYSGHFAGSPARGLVFGYNASTGDRRISGSAAALAGLDQAVADGDAAATDLAVARLLLAHALVLGWGGVPVLWMGDGLGLPNDAHWADEPGHGDDNRWAHRPRMPWAIAAQRYDPATVPGRLFTGVRDLARARAALPQLHASVPAQVLDPADPGVFAVLRDHPVGPMLGLYNMTPDWRAHPADHLESLGARWDAITGDVFRPGGDGQVWLPPYAARWIIPSPP